jgi:hypothetical protein
MQELRSQELQKLQEFRRKVPNRPRTQKEWYSLAKAIGRWFAGEGDVGEASRFALFRMEQTGTVGLRLRPLQAEIYGHFVARASNWGQIKDRHAGTDTDTNSFCPPRTQHASGQSLDRRQQ